MVETSSELWKYLSDVARDEGRLLYDVERIGDDTIRVMIRRDMEVNSGAMQSGVNSDDCSRLCKRLMVQLLADGKRLGVGAEPEIEVSSPGINRKLRLLEHFQAAVGERVKLVANAFEENERAAGAVTGKIKDVQEEVISLVEESTKEKLSIRYGEVKRARVDFLFD